MGCLPARQLEKLSVSLIRSLRFDSARFAGYANRAYSVKVLILAKLVLASVKLVGKLKVLGDAQVNCFRSASSAKPDS
jgi:hypothetical protein